MNMSSTQIPGVVSVALLASDSFCDAVLDRLTAARRCTISLDRRDMRAALLDVLATVFDQNQEAK